jgi:hypothetical protein
MSAHMGRDITRCFVAVHDYSSGKGSRRKDNKSGTDYLIPCSHAYGERDFWGDADAPKANKYQGVVSDTNSTIDFPVDWVWETMYSGSIGDQFEQVPEPYPTCDACVPTADNIPFSYFGLWQSAGFGADGRRSTEDSWLNMGRWIDIWGYAAKKYGSAPPERHSDPYRNVDVHAMETGSRGSPLAGVRVQNHVLHIGLGEPRLASRAQVAIYSLNGQRVFSTSTSESAVELPPMHQGAYMAVVKNGHFSWEQKVIVK